MTTLALIGANALWLMYAWLLSAIIASYLSERKGYGEKVGLASGLLLSVLGPLVWLAWPARAGSKWKTIGPFTRRKAGNVTSAKGGDEGGQGGDEDGGSEPGARAAGLRDS